MPRRVVLVLASLLVGGCFGAPATAPRPVRKPVAVANLPSAAPVLGGDRQLAHEGGIVFARPIDAIADASKRDAASAITNDLSVALGVDGVMRDASLLATSTSAPAAYALIGLDDGPTAPAPSGSPTRSTGGGTEGDGTRLEDGATTAADVAATTAERPDAPASGTRSPAPDGGADHHEDADRQRDENEAKAAWKGLDETTRAHAEGVQEAHEGQLRAKLADRLSREKQAFARRTADQVVMAADGGKTVTASFAVAAVGGNHNVTSTRVYDAQGSLVQTTETLAGTASGGTISAERTRTLSPDGSVTLTSTTTLVVGGQNHTVNWTQHIAADGSLSAAGSIARADGSHVTLSATGQLAGTQSVVATDAATGVSVTVQLDPAASKATASVQAGAAGEATLDLNVDAVASDPSKAATL